jgi:hexosaminidase
VTVALVPQPRSFKFTSGSVTWQSPLRVSVAKEWRHVVDTFGADLKASVGWDVLVVGDDDECDIDIRPHPEFDREQFEIRISKVTFIWASSAAGVAYAFTLLRQMGPDELWSSARTELTQFELPCAIVKDGPLFEWRGVHLDVARHFYDVDTVCRLIDQIAAHRLNRLHLHLNDDQGWRVEVPGRPLLTEVGSHRRSSPLGHELEGRDDNVPHGGFFTDGDLLAIRGHAAKRFVQIVPEIDLPGHAQAVIAAYPELGNLVEPLEVWTRWGISEHVLNVSAAALQFAEDVVLHVAGLFPDSPVHIGGDECPTAEWEASPLASQVMAQNGFIDARELQGLFTQRLTLALQRHGHRVVAWDEVLDAQVLAGTIIAAWRDAQKGTEAAERGFDVIMAPMQDLYFDWLSSLDPDEPVALAPPPQATTWEKVYGFRIIPEDLDPSRRYHIIGAQVQLWTEYIATRDHLDYMAFPRIAAFSEVVWGTTGALGDFRLRLEAHLGRLAAMGVKYRDLDPA